MPKLNLPTCAAMLAASWLSAGCDELPAPEGDDPLDRPPREQPPSPETEPTNGVEEAERPTMVDLAPVPALDSPSHDEVSAADASSNADVAVTADAGEPDLPTGKSDEDLTCHPLLAHGGDDTTSYAVGVAPDRYVAFTFAAPWQETAYAVLFRTKIDNSKVVHHWLLYQDDSPGTPGAVVEELFGAHPDAQLIAAWTPGTDGLDLRDADVDVGVELPHDTTYTLELHYDSDDPAAIDRSGVEVCTRRHKPAHVAGYSWLGHENLFLPSATWTGICAPSLSEPVRILAIVPHMHYKGTHMKATVNRADGTHEVFHDHDFDYYYGQLYPLDLTLEPGDSVTTTCSYSEPVTYGEGASMEMCYMFTVAYPSRTLISPDFVGGLFHGRTSCLGQ